MRSAPVLDTDKRPGSKLRPKQYLRPSGIARRVGAFVLREREMLPPTIFIGLLPAARSSSEKPCWLPTRPRSIRRYNRAPLIRPILFKAAFYWAVVFVARLLEHWIRFWLVEHLGHSCRTWLRRSTGIALSRFSSGYWFRL